MDDLAAVDEFHVGGREATRALLEQLDIAEDSDVLDIGCGIGGAARFAATEFDCQVICIDLTEEYVNVGNQLCAWTGCDARVTLRVADAEETGLDTEGSDKAYMLHVGMNVRNKDALASEVFRLLRPGGLFGIYDLMRVGDGELRFPLPWATDNGTNSIAQPDSYRRMLETAGFELLSERNRRSFALDVADRMQARLQNHDGPPPLGLHLLMGADATEKYRNMVASLAANDIAPIEIVARKLPSERHSVE